MNFSEALDYLKEGRKVRSIDWAPDDYVFLKDKRAYNQDGIETTFDFEDTQSDWDFFPEVFFAIKEDPNAPKWIKFSESHPVNLPFWMYADGSVSLQYFQVRNYLSSVEDTDNAAWKNVEYPLPPGDEKQYTKWIKK